jgi:hypothetical protein
VGSRSGCSLPGGPIATPCKHAGLQGEHGTGATGLEPATSDVLRKGFSHLVAKFQMVRVPARVDAKPEAQRRPRGGTAAGDAPGAFLERRRPLGGPGAVRQRPAGGVTGAEDRLHPDGAGRDQPVQEDKTAEGSGLRSSAAAVRVRLTGAGALRGLQRRGVDDDQARG